MGRSPKSSGWKCLFFPLEGKINLKAPNYGHFCFRTFFQWKKKPEGADWTEAFEQKQTNTMMQEL